MSINSVAGVNGGLEEVMEAFAHERNKRRAIRRERRLRAQERRRRPERVRLLEFDAAYVRGKHFGC